jgi:shikimate kinase
VIEQVVLVGLPGAGKSTVGAALADRIGWRFVDFDTEIERQTGKTVAELFAIDGEPSFRALEKEMTIQYRDTMRSVLSPGGGWIAQDGLRALLRPTSRIIHLIVSPDEAARRLGDRRQDRPLLAAAADPVARLRQLADDRALAYAAADRVVATDGRTVNEVVDQLAALLADQQGT